jgi:hypothetical protein
MRCPETLNYKTDPPSPSAVLSTEIHTYSFESFKEFLGEIKVEEEPEFSLDKVSKGLDEDTLAIYKADNFENKFEIIADKSMNGTGCEQIKFAIEHRDNLPEPIWRNTLSVIKFCSDGGTWAHELFKGDPRYSRENTEQYLTNIGGTMGCDEFDDKNPGVCQGCKHYKQLKNPLPLGRELKIAKPADKKDAPWANPNSEEIPDLAVFITCPSLR